MRAVLAAAILTILAAAHEIHELHNSDSDGHVYFPHGTGTCGTGLPHVTASGAAARSVAQRYSAAGEFTGNASFDSHARATQTSFVPIDEAEANGETANIRIKVRTALITLAHGFTRPLPQLYRVFSGMTRRSWSGESSQAETILFSAKLRVRLRRLAQVLRAAGRVKPSQRLTSFCASWHLQAQPLGLFLAPLLTL